MILLVDIGNTRVKWAYLNDGCVSDTGILQFSPRYDIKEILHKKWCDLPVPQKVFVSNVAGDLIEDIMGGWIQEYWHLETVFVSAQAADFGVVNGYTDPRQLGIDRWVSLIAVHHMKLGAACIIDCGTATTLDVISALGKHMGGLITPGLGLMQDSLNKNTNKIRLRSANKFIDANLLARNTQDGVLRGTKICTAAFIEHIVSHLGKILDVNLSIVITGGDAEEVLPLLKISYLHDPHLVLKGLAIVSGELK